MNYGSGHSIYFLGIGGIGMSALARYFQHKGADIAGYDRIKTRLTRELESEGMKIHYHEDIHLLPQEIDLAIYTPAIPDTHAELQLLQKKKIPLIKRAEALGMISKNHFTIAVAGTHGKTTITSMIAHILYGAGKGICAFIGGIANNFNSNFVITGYPEFYIIEADEYDKSFLHLRPDIAVISALDADHLDVYHTRDQMLESYAAFAANAAAKGSLVLKAGSRLPVDLPHQSYGLDANSHVRAEEIVIQDGLFCFDLAVSNASVPVKLRVAGRHNIENALAAATACLLCGVSLKQIGDLLSTYTGVRRRFDIQINKPETVYIDDYAHHPNELKACILTAKELFPGKEITGIFQPHLYSRTRDFIQEFADSLSTLDQLILLDIYPAREQAIEGISSERLLEKVAINKKMMAHKHELIPLLETLKPKILLSMGAGDIDQLVEPIKNLLQSW